MDTISCGPGNDEVTANRSDIIVNDPSHDDVCETVHLVGKAKKPKSAKHADKAGKHRAWTASPAGGRAGR